MERNDPETRPPLAMPSDPLWQRLLHSRRLGRVCLVLAIITFVNWFVHFGHCESIGGWAVGTKPAEGRFYVNYRARSTDVDERTWLISLYYSTATLVTAPIGFGCFAFLIVRKLAIAYTEKGFRPSLWAVRQVALFAFIGFFILFSVVWMVAIMAGFITSLRAYLSL